MNSIRVQLLITFFAVLVIALLIPGLSSYLYFSDLLTKSALVRLQAVAHEKEHAVETYFNGSAEQLRFIGRSIEVQGSSAELGELFDGGMDSSEYRRELELIQPILNNGLTVSGFDDLYLVSTNLDILASARSDVRQFNLPDLDSHSESGLGSLIKKSVEQQGVMFAGFGHHSQVNKRTAFLSIPLSDSVGDVGFIVARLDVASLRALTSNFSGLGLTGETVLVAVVDDMPTAVGTLRHVSAEKSITFPFIESNHLPVIKALNGESSIGESIDYRGEPVVAFWTRLPSSELAMGVKMDAVEILAPVSELNIWFWVSFGVNSLLILIAVWFIDNRISRPVRKLARAADSIAHGDLQKDLSEEGNAEIVRLTRSFNTMQHALNAAQAELKRVNIDLEKRVDERTVDLQKVNDKLEQTLVQLMQTQQSTIQTEKMAALGQLAAGVGHEVNNPLMGLVGYLEYAAKHSDNPKLDSVYTKALGATERIRDIISTMMTYAHKSDHQVTSVNVAETIASVLDLAATDLRHADITVIAAIPDDLSEVAVNENELYQCLLNLLLNARDALVGCDNREISITAEELVLVVSIEITDSGPGVPEDIRGKVFDPFFTTKAVGKGTGLGLSVSKNLIEKSGGKLSLEDSAKNGGAKFKITLPKVKS